MKKEKLGEKRLRETAQKIIKDIQDNQGKAGFKWFDYEEAIVAAIEQGRREAVRSAKRAEYELEKAKKVLYDMATMHGPTQEDLIESALREEYKRGVQDAVEICRKQQDAYFNNMEGMDGDDFIRYDFAVSVSAHIGRRIKDLLDGRDDERG